MPPCRRMAVTANTEHTWLYVASFRHNHMTDTLLVIKMLYILFMNPLTRQLLDSLRLVAFNRNIMICYNSNPIFCQTSLPSLSRIGLTRLGPPESWIMARSTLHTTISPVVTRLLPHASEISFWARVIIFRSYHKSG